VIRVALVDDQTLVRKGLRGLLETTADLAVVAEACDGEEALEVVPAAAPDVLLLDVRMPRLDGLGVLRRLGQDGRLPATILLTTFDDDEALLEGIRAGARGFLLKDVSLTQLTDAIRAVARGELLLRPAVTERVLHGLQRVRGEFAHAPRPERLSHRELEVLRLMAAGFSNREIAEVLDASEGTIKNHVSSILGKLGVRDRTRAVLRALELGYL
jgi:DNA-binding NarL/FixJ family response regulator